MNTRESRLAFLDVDRLNTPYEWAAEGLACFAVVLVLIYCVVNW